MINLNLQQLALAASLLLSASVPVSAQFASPVGSAWDCVVSGHEQGVAYITFNEDGTLTGYELLTYKLSSSSTEVDPRGATTVGRTVETSPDGSSQSFVYGFTDFNGHWTHDYTGKKILGFFSEVITTPEVCTTNETTIEKEVCTTIQTNGTTILSCETIRTPTNIVECTPATAITNGLSFSAIVKPGIRLSMKVFSQNGNRTLKGVVATEISDLTGPYYAEGVKNRLKFVNTFTAASSGAYPNAFDIDGDGGGYGFIGIALASSQKKLGLALRNLEEDSSLVSLFGSINYGKRLASLKGTDGNTKISYKIKPQP